MESMHVSYDEDTQRLLHQITDINRLLIEANEAKAKAFEAYAETKRELANFKSLYDEKLGINSANIGGANVGGGGGEGHRWVNNITSVPYLFSYS